MYYNIFIVFLFPLCFVTNISADIEKHIKTLHGNEDLYFGTKKTIILNADIQNDLPDTRPRKKRAAEPITDEVKVNKTSKYDVKVNYLNDTHKQLMVHWVGEKTKVVICVARDAAAISPFANVVPSSVYISYDDGDTYKDKTDSFKTPNGSYATLEKFYNHPTYNTHFVFTDIRHNLIYVTKDHGKNFERRELVFTPSQLSFHIQNPGTFVVLDKNDTHNMLWITEDFGYNFRVAHEFVKSFTWMKDANENQQLIVQRYEPNGLTLILYSKNLFKSRTSLVYSTHVKDFFFKGDYLFTTKTNAKGDLELYVSYKLGKQLLCIFNSIKTFRTYYIVDVTGGRAIIAGSHSNDSSDLYVSENLGGNDGQVKFTLSLKDVFAHFPNSTWQNTWLNQISEEAFADVYKVEGLSGIYIASKVISKPVGSNFGPQHLASVITYDHGATWRPIRPPATDVSGQSIPCISNNCSLHLSQKFSHLQPDTRFSSILSSESAPGIIVATGVLGQNLKGHPGIYVSMDAGLTWRQTLRELFFYNMGDHGGIITAVKYFKTKGETRHILYSIDEGKNWNMTKFHDEEIRLYGLMTEPGSNTTVFTMFGSLPNAHQWMIVKVDFQKVFNGPCGESDYKMWSPSQSDENRSYIPCVLGEQTTYQRRITNSPCYNGIDHVQPIRKQACDCDILDYECDFGFARTGNPPHCIRDKTIVYDPYKVPQTCKPGQFFNRTKGYKKISGDKCIGGFESHYLPDQVPCPFKEVDDFILFAQRERISRYNLITRNMEELPVKNLKNVIAIDFDMASNCVYWADIALDTIGRQCFGNGSKEEILVSSDLASIEGMAFDWISKTLYFVDGVRSKIELIRTDINHSGRMRKTILDQKVLHKPRGIALHPQNGYMFWTDWSTEKPSVNRANLDGSNNTMLFGKEKVDWPNGITVDYIANRIYWVDARRDYIGSSDLHGDSFLQLASGKDVVSHPFAIAVFKNNMYWDDWKRNSIFSADKDSSEFKGIEVIIKQLPGLMDLKVFAQGLQIGSNACTNANCSYICVGLPKNGHRCLCPDGLISNDTKLEEDKKCMCPGNVEPFGNMTCPSVGNTCSSEHFTCGNGLCIPKGWRCDGDDDCGDNSDESQCGDQTCPTTSFACGDGKCVPRYWRCDFDSDCEDGSDELNCPRPKCIEGQFTCDNGRCISSKWRCDGENDCRDESDERNCNDDTPSVCKKDEFQCKSGAVTCIPSTWKCDLEFDCRDRTDEENCQNNTCSENQFSCGAPNNRCIYNTWVCDGDRDCPDGRDEVNCTTAKPELPNKPPIHFIPKNGTCQEWMFRCQNQRCIPFWWKCDNADDCGDASDEIGCAHTDVPVEATTLPERFVCENNQYQCATGECIFSSWVCDGMYDCTNGEDENNCDVHRNCSHNEFKCRIDGSCVPLSSVCDHNLDCPDGTDETSCDENIPTPSCSAGHFSCDRGSCYPLAVVCDHKTDCKDQSDEINCTTKTRVYQVIQMNIDERGINDTSLLLYWWIATPQEGILEFMPAISNLSEINATWYNATWQKELSYHFSNLKPFTKYNMTVYVRIQNTSTVFPPAKYFLASTTEGIPSEPLNVSGKQINASHILISWKEPKYPYGIITYYDICWQTPEAAPVLMKYTGNETSHLFSSYFEHNVPYKFWVIAHNRKYESPQSLPFELCFDGKTILGSIKELKIVNGTDGIVSLAWKYDDNTTIPQGFNVTIDTLRPYPHLPARLTNTNNITIQLAPGTSYHLGINAFKNGLTGPSTYISVTTSGTKLPMINISQASLLKPVGTTVKLSWERPKYSKKISWKYGVYYSINAGQIFEKPNINTTNETITITNLDACETYVFTIGLVGPLGYGPLSTNFKQISTSNNPKAPPKGVQVERATDPLRMKVQWSHSCPSAQPDYYVVKVVEKSTTQTWHSRINGTQLSRIFNVSYGGIYDVSVATGEYYATYSKPVRYYSPSIDYPIEFDVTPVDNGSFSINWKTMLLPKDIGHVSYEIFVSEGKTFNASTAKKIEVEKPPYYYTNFSASTFTFAVRVKASKNLQSIISQSVTKTLAHVVKSSVNLTAVVVPSLIVLIALIAVITFIIIRYRKLHSSFTRFANSHYDTRSQAATFDDSSLEEDDSPHFRGFSDDEPLVIA